TAYCLLPTAYCLLPTAYSSLHDVQWSIRRLAVVVAEDGPGLDGLDAGLGRRGQHAGRDERGLTIGRGPGPFEAAAAVRHLIDDRDRMRPGGQGDGAGQ